MCRPNAEGDVSTLAAVQRKAGRNPHVFRRSVTAIAPSPGCGTGPGTKKTEPCRTERQHPVCKGTAWSILVEGPERCGTADDCGSGDRPEVAAVKGCRFVPVHEEDLTGGDVPATLPDRESVV